MRICRYLKGTRECSLKFKPGSVLDLNCYADAGFAGLWNVEPDQEPVCVKLRSGYVLTLGGCPLLWTSKLQTEVALSTLEAEYICLSQAMQELIPMQGLLKLVVEKLGLVANPSATIRS